MAVATSLHTVAYITDLHGPANRNMHTSAICTGGLKTAVAYTTAPSVMVRSNYFRHQYVFEKRRGHIVFILCRSLTFCTYIFKESQSALKFLQNPFIRELQMNTVLKKVADSHSSFACFTHPIHSRFAGLTIVTYEDDWQNVILHVPSKRRYISTRLHCVTSRPIHFSWKTESEKEVLPHDTR